MADYSVIWSNLLACGKNVLIKSFGIRFLTRSKTCTEKRANILRARVYLPSLSPLSLPLVSNGPVSPGTTKKAWIRLLPVWDPAWIKDQDSDGVVAGAIYTSMGMPF